MSQAAPQVLYPMDVVKLGMVIAYVAFQVNWEEGCALSPWLLNLWKILLGELVLKFLTQACCSKTSVANFLIGLIMFGETLWNLYGLFIYFTRVSICSHETEVAFKVALGLYVASNISVILLGLFRFEQTKKTQ